MFKCMGCPDKYNRKRKLIKNNTVLGETLFRVITVVRKVRYINQVRFDKVVPQGEGSKLVTTYKDVGETLGTEIVEEECYCQNHIPKNTTPKVLDGVVERINLVAIKRPHRGEN